MMIVGGGLILLAIAAVQLAFWLVVQPLLFARTEPPEFLEIRSAAFAQLAAPNLQAMNAVTYKPVELPYDGCCVPGYGSLKAEFELDQVPERGLEMASPRGVDNMHVAINGAWVHAPGRLELPRNTYHGLLKSVIHLPASTLHTSAMWWSLPEDVLEEAGIATRDLPGAVHALEHAGIGMLPLFATCDRWDLGGISYAHHPQFDRPAVFVYDGWPGGVGLARTGFARAEELFAEQVKVRTELDRLERERRSAG